MSSQNFKFPNLSLGYIVSSLAAHRLTLQTDSEETIGESNSEYDFRAALTEAEEEKYSLIVVPRTQVATNRQSSSLEQMPASNEC